MIAKPFLFSPALLQRSKALYVFFSESAATVVTREHAAVSLVGSTSKCSQGLLLKTSLTCPQSICSIGSSRGVGEGGGKKHEIYVAAFGGHLFYDLFVQGWGRHGPLGTPPGSATDLVVKFMIEKVH